MLLGDLSIRNQYEFLGFLTEVEIPRKVYVSLNYVITQSKVIDLTVSKIKLKRKSE